MCKVMSFVGADKKQSYAGASLEEAAVALQTAQANLEREEGKILMSEEAQIAALKLDVSEIKTRIVVLENKHACCIQ